MSRRNSDAGRMAVVWLATVVIIVIGAFASAFVIFASAEQVQVPMTIWGCSFTGLFLVLFLMNMRWEEPINQLKFWLSWGDRNDPTDGYRAGPTQHRNARAIRNASSTVGRIRPRRTRSRRSLGSTFIEWKTISLRIKLVGAVSVFVGPGFPGRAKLR